MSEQETRDEGAEKAGGAKADMSDAGREFQEAMEGPRKRRGCDDPQDHVGHGCPLDPTGDEWEETPGLAEALASVSAFLRGDARADVHCVNVRTGERMVVHGTRDEVEEAIRAANAASDRAGRAARVVAASVAVVVIGSLAAVGLVHLLRRRS